MKQSTSLEASYQDDKPGEFRERTNSDPLQQKPSLRKKGLTRMISLPVSPDSDSIVQPDLDPQRSLGTDMMLSAAGMKIPFPGIRIDEDQESFQESEGEIQRSGEDRSETTSVASRDSSLYPAHQNLLYTDSEDNRSVSNRSGNIGDSGFC